jgi:hypothetical protein
MCATDSWGAHESFMHPIFVLKNGCDNLTTELTALVNALDLSGWYTRALKQQWWNSNR